MKIFERLHIWLIVVAAALLASCTKDAYDTGDSSLSYLKAEMVNMHVSGNQVTDIVTDADEQLDISSSFKLSNDMARVDTTYRMMLYYTKEDNQPIEVKSMRLASIAAVTNKMSALTLATDPLTLTSIWKSENGKYINMSLGVMTGNADSEDASQKLSIVCDSAKVTTGRCYYLTVHHDQASVPQYYTQTYYVSIPISGLSAGDQVVIGMNTYNGWVEKNFMK